LSSLRRFTAFLAAAKLLPTDPGQQLKNLTSTTFDSILDQFQTFLKSENLTPSTIKNYLSDVKNYLIWAQENIKTTDGDLAQRPLS
jgi:site-specific recombinase XerD